MGKTNKTTAGTGDKICCCALGTVAVTGGWESDAGLVTQHGMMPPLQHDFVGCAAHATGGTTVSACPPRNIRLHRIVSTNFTFLLLPIRLIIPARILPFTAHFLAGLSAARILAMNLAGSLSNSGLQSAQQNFTSWP